MFNAIATKDELESFTDPLSTLVDECKLHLEPEGLRTRAVDPANVGMVESELGAAAFESYEADDGVIGINLDRFEDVIGMADAGQLIHLELDEETRKLHIDIEGLSYTLALIDPSSIRQEPDLPDLGDDLPFEVVVEGRHINRGVTAADMVSDHIRLRSGTTDAGEDAFVIEAEGDTDTVEVTLDQDEVLDLTHGAASSLYSLDYLKDMNKAIDAGAEVTIELGEEYPVNLFFDTAEGQGSVRFMLAPRIQSD